MEKQNYTTTITVSKTPEEVFNSINSVSNWWSKDFKGKSTKLNDEFIICHPDRHYSKHKLIEAISNKKVVWHVTDGKLSWLKKDKYEWTYTKIIFELTTEGDKTLLQFTHEGLVPGKECYAMCEQGWNMVIKERLFNFITIGKAYQ
jgi:hypothetical protein